MIKFWLDRRHPAKVQFRSWMGTVHTIQTTRVYVYVVPGTFNIHITTFTLIFNIISADSKGKSNDFFVHKKYF